MKVSLTALELKAALKYVKKHKIDSVELEFSHSSGIGMAVKVSNPACLRKKHKAKNITDYSIW
jgi:hypothetical protein